MEPFGIPQRDELGQKLKLQVAFVKLRLTQRKLPLRNLNPYLKYREPSFPAIIEQEISDLSDAVQLTEKNDINLLPGQGQEPRDLLSAQLKSWEEVIGPLSWTKSEFQDLVAHRLPNDPIQEEVSFDQALAGERRIMIEGPAGSGKSTLLQWMAVQAAQDSFPDSMHKWNGLIPYFIRLRRCGREGFPGPEDWPRLEAKSIQGKMPPGWVHDQLESGRALLLIDGVDEMPQKQRRELLRELKALVKNYPLARYVVTSRPLQKQKPCKMRAK